MNSWQEYLHSDKVLLAVVLALIVAVWVITREPKLFDLGNTALGALIAIITGVAGKRNGGAS